MSKDDGNSYDGRIWCRDEDRDRVNDLKRGGETQADVLERVLDFYDEHDPSDAPNENVDHGPDVDALADALAERINTRTDTAAIANATASEVESRLR